MHNTIKTIQWNIGAGKVRAADADPLAGSSYATDDLPSIIELLRSEAPDIITLQETHADENRDQIADIARGLGYEYYTSDYFSDSHIEAGQKLGQGIISRLPMANPTSVLFTNPLFEVTWRNGTSAVTHDKGITSCTLSANGLQLTVKTLHLIPFDPFKVDPLSAAAKPIFMDVQSKLVDVSEHMLIQGDFNLGSHNPPTEKVMPALAKAGLHELEHTEPTIPYGEWPDRVLYKGLKLIDSKIMSKALTDHYPVVATFEI